MGKISVSVLGGTREVGKSAILLEAGGTRVLLDYGMKLIPKEHPQFPPIPEKVDAVLLSHAHLDHSGSLPRLVRKGFDIPIYGIDITREYIDLLLYDAIKVAKLKEHNIGYGSKEVRKVLNNFRPVEFNVPFKIGDLEITAFNAGHIPGSAMFYIRYDGRSLLYTGDFNTLSSRLMPPAQIENIPEVDILITESTYAMREHPPREKQESLLKEIIIDTLKSGGTAVVAGFAIGRLLEVAMALRAKGFRGKIFLDGMARRSTEITELFSNRVRDSDDLKLTTMSITSVRNWQMRKKIAKKPNVILTTSGMLEGGPVHYYMKERREDENSTITLTGYQVDGTEGRRLLEEGRVEIEGEETWIMMKVNQLNFSAHASRSGILRMINELKPESIMVVHGEHSNLFAEELEDKMGISSFSPEIGEEIIF